MVEDGKGIAVGWVVVKAKVNKQGDTNGRFRVPVRSTCTHNGLIIHYKA